MDHTFKILVVGVDGTGKTTFVNSYNSKIHDPLTGVDVHPLNFVTNDCITHKEEKICFVCWDIPGKNQSSDFLQRYCKGTSGAIIMFDVTKRPTYNKATGLINMIRRDSGNIPIVLCGNKVDLLNKQKHVNVSPFGGRLDWNTKYCEISALSNYNLERPFLLLAWMLVRLSISFTQTPTLFPTDFKIDLEAQRRNEQEIFSALFGAHMQAIRERALMPVVVRILNRRRNRAPDAPLPVDDDELMKWMLKSMMMKW